MGENRVYAIDHVVTTGGNCTAQGPCWYPDICPTEKASGVHAVCYAFEPGAAQRLNTEARVNKDISPTLRNNMGDNQPAVVYCMDGKGHRADSEIGSHHTSASSQNCLPNTTHEKHPQEPIVIYEGQNCGTNNTKAYSLQASRPDDHHLSVVTYKRVHNE